MAYQNDMNAALERTMEQGRAELNELRRIGVAPEVLHETQRNYDRLIDDIRKGRIMDMGWTSAMGAVGGGSGTNAMQAAQNIFGTGLQGGLGNQVQASIANGAMAQGMPMKPAEAEEGVLMFRGAPLPEKWLGALYDAVDRVPVGRQWRIEFRTQYGSDTIMLWLSMEKYSGNEADKVANTYLETINQRRLG